jgi:uncharacterized protein with beta-barrel porin domain
MSIKTAINLVNSTGLSKFFKKIFNYFSISTIILGSTLNSANAIDMGANTDDIWADEFSGSGSTTIANPTSGAAVDLKASALSITNASLMTVLGAIDADGGNATSDILVTQNANGALSVTIASIAGDVADLTTTGKAAATGALTVTVTGAVALTENLTTISQATANDVDVTTTIGGAITMASGKDVVITGSNGDGTGGSNAILNVNGTGTNALVDVELTDDVGFGIINFGGSAAQTITGTIDGTSAAHGTVHNKNTGAAVTVSGIIGGGNTVRLVETDASTSTILNGATTTAATVTNAGTIAANSATSFNVDTVTNTGTLSVKGATIIGDDGSGVQTITNTGTLNLIGEATVTATATILGAGTVNIFDGSGGAAIVNTISGAIGADGTNVTAINVGADDSSNTDAGRVVFSGVVFADAVTITSGEDSSEQSTATFVGSVTAPVTLATATGGDAQAIFAAGSGATSVVTGAIDGAGDVLVEGGSISTTTFNSSLGANTTLKEFHVGDADIADINLNLTATNITFDDATSELEITGAVDQTVTGLMDGDATGGIGILQISNDATIVSNVGATHELADIIVADAKSATFSGVVKTEDWLMGSTATGGSSVTLAQDGHVIGDDTQGDTGILTFGKNLTLTLDDTISAGETIFDVDNTDSAAATNGVVVTAGTTIKLPGNFTTGAITLIDGDVALAVTAAEFLLLDAADTALSSYTLTHTDSLKDVTITATDKSAADIASSLGTTTNEGTGLLQARAAIIAGGTASELDTITGVLNTTGSFTASDDTALAKQVAPQTDLISGSSVAAQGVTGSIQGIMSNRMASLRSGDAYFGTGVAAGGMSAQSGFIQVFGSSAEQKSTTVGSGTQAGFDSETQGVAIGFDGISDEGMTIGVSVATANTDVDGKGTGKSVNSIDTYSAALYMDTSTDAGYFEGSLTFGVNENSTSRKITSAGLNRTLSGSYDSQSLSLNLSAGMPNEVGAGYLTPFGSFTASTMNIDAYTEKSTVANDALRLKIAQDDINSMIGTVGLKFHGEMDNGGMPMISLAINNEFGDSSIDSNNTFQGGGTVFKTTTAVEELSATLGLGYSYGTDAASIEFAYEADANDDKYMSHYGSIKIVGKF